MHLCHCVVKSIHICLLCVYSFMCIFMCMFYLCVYSFMSKFMCTFMSKFMCMDMCLWIWSSIRKLYTRSILFTRASIFHNVPTQIHIRTFMHTRNHNHASHTGDGGAIYAFSTLYNISDCSFIDNHARAGAGGALALSFMQRRADTPDLDLKLKRVYPSVPASGMTEGGERGERGEGGERGERCGRKLGSLSDYWNGGGGGREGW